MNATINIRTDKKLKSQAEQIFKMLGLNMSSAFNAFLQATVRENGLPFELKLHEPNKETIQAILEGRKIAKNPKSKGYKNTNEMWKELGV